MSDITLAPTTLRLAACLNGGVIQSIGKVRGTREEAKEKVQLLPEGPASQKKRTPKVICFRPTMPCRLVLQLLDPVVHHHQPPSDTELKQLVKALVKNNAMVIPDEATRFGYLLKRI